MNNKKKKYIYAPCYIESVEKKIVEMLRKGDKEDAVIEIYNKFIKYHLPLLEEKRAGVFCNHVFLDLWRILSYGLGKENFKIVMKYHRLDKREYYIETIIHFRSDGDIAKFRGIYPHKFLYYYYGPTTIGCYRPEKME